eukprot:TRINITY_DN25225_c0_g1_i1.p1 TRINITY_DN25225_c0_g1~~TRINITY_DN25225_c0_g1_i1.p1  ORF type:complete len:721 (+),score=242.90 TRINITY_DN25225_c0_g1_i1:67-2163(+)
MALPSIRRLQQQQCEVASSLRVAVDNDGAAEKVAAAVATVELFLRDMDDASDEMQLPVDFIIQALLGELVTEKDVQKQGGSEGNVVPMHQNKVLDRSNRVVVLDADRVKDQRWVIRQVKENLPKLLESLRILRDLVKIKVEDANDVDMARKWSATASAFFNHLRVLSNATGSLSGAWEAVEAGEVPDGAQLDVTARTLQTTVGSPLLSGGGALTEDEIASIQDLAAPFEDRVAVLNALASASEDAIMERADMIRTGLVAQLKDNRSQILRAAVPAAQHVALAPCWDAMSLDVVSAILARLHLANSGLSKLFSAALDAFAKQGPRAGVVSHLAQVATTSQLPNTQSKCTECLTLYVSTHRPPTNMAIWGAAEAACASRHGACRTAGKALQAACKKVWPDMLTSAEKAAKAEKAAAAAEAAAAPARGGTLKSGAGAARRASDAAAKSRSKTVEGTAAGATAPQRRTSGAGAAAAKRSRTLSNAEQQPAEKAKASAAARKPTAAAQGPRRGSAPDAVPTRRNVKAVSSSDPPEKPPSSEPAVGKEDLIVVDWPNRTKPPPKLSSRRAPKRDAEAPASPGSALIKQSDKTERVSLLAERRASFKERVAALNAEESKNPPAVSAKQEAAAPVEEAHSGPPPRSAASFRTAASELPAFDADRELSSAPSNDSLVTGSYESPMTLTLLKTRLEKRRLSRTGKTEA